ncbi:hypothetical protein [Spongiactinospora sp. TRM90649]|uniref:hypothetical protein n=1 Tax=Spongiactinospora sp. TRM90649 TaxID=3031114 RepID=UPI0023F982FC|nr:hypothetical protein [Spongiactinospora sp. TRM90649]MDF5751610.1 hypothetical protein [Spongiactinospora sp. TRM90649]
MRIKSTVLAAMTALPLVGAGLLGTAGPASAAAPCVVNNVCVETLGGVDLIPAGSRRFYSPSVTIRSVTNLTKLGYCIGGDLSFGLGPWQTVTRVQTVSSVAPGNICLQ